MTPRITTVLAVVGLGSTSLAQTPSFVYSIQGPGFLVPGQTATFTILCGFSPGVGGIVTTPIGPRPVLGLSSGSFNLVGPAGSGSWSNLALIAPYNFIGTTVGLAAGANVTGAIWGNGFGPPLGTVSTVNPTPLWTGTFTMGAAPLFLQLNPVGLHGVWAGNPGEIAVEVLSNQTTGAIVPPAPASLASFALAGWVAATRRRRSGP